LLSKLLVVSTLRFGWIKKTYQECDSIERERGSAKVYVLLERERAAAYDGGLHLLVSTTDNPRSPLGLGPLSFQYYCIRVLYSKLGFYNDGASGRQQVSPR